MLKVSQEDLVKSYPSLVSLRVDNKNYKFKVDVLDFKEPVNKRKCRYIPTLVEVDFNTSKKERVSFTLRGWSRSCKIPKLRQGHAGNTSSFNYTKRYLLKVPVEYEKEDFGLIFRIEVYSNVFTHGGAHKEVQYHYNMKGKGE